MQRSSAVISIVTFALLGARADSQELEPRAYANAPVGLNFLIAGYALSEGGLVVDPSIPLENADLEIHTGLLAFARSFDAWGRSAKFDIIAPYVSLSGTAEAAGQLREREVSGWADPRLRVSINLLGAPAVSLQEISTYRQDLIVGLSLQAWAPLGHYDKDKVVNLGANRWAIKPELGISKAIGRWTIELALAAALYDDNDEYLIDKTREQDPIYSAQCSVIYSFPRGVWIAAGGTYYTGGRSTIDGVRGNDLQENSRFGATLTLPINRSNSVKIYANTGVSTRTGSDFDSVGLAWQHRWGAGL